MIDVIIAGAGPAGAVAAIVLARAGARVLLLDRARFPRPKLCGDSLNPGAVAVLGRLALARFPEERAVLAAGIVVTGEGGVEIEGRYPTGFHGRFVTRTVLDAWLLDQAIAAGACFEDASRVVGPVVTSSRRGVAVAGVRVVRAGSGERDVRAPVTIAADGRRSALAFALGLAHHPARPRRWAVGAYFEGVTGLSSFGEMHVRGGRYIGVAPLPGGIANACLVTDDRAVLRGCRDATALLATQIAGDPMLAARFASAHAVAPAVVLGPLAVDSTAAGVPGLLLAGDAAGFVDPMTGDGLHFAIRGGELAAGAALSALSGGTASAHRLLAGRRRRAFSWKRRFNRALRAVVSRPSAVTVASQVARACPAAVRRMVRFAGDVGR